MTTDGVAMQGYTGTDGSASFTLFPAIQYGITITNASAGLTNYVTLYPQDNDYLIRCPLATQSSGVGSYNRDDEYLPLRYRTKRILHNLEPTLSGSSDGFTTALTWNVTCWNNMTVMHSNSWGALGSTDVVVDNYTFPSTPVGMEYRALYSATRTLP